MSSSETVSGHAVHGAVNCEQALGKLFEFLDSELPEADADRIRAHLEYCEPCLAEYDVEEHVRALVRRSCSECPPVELHVRIRQSLTVLRTQIP
jgi:anti-sigma factor (TIGR02949 family)